MPLIKAALREPLLHFLMLGLLLYGAAVIHARLTDRTRIVVTHADVEMLADRYGKQFGAPPSPSRLGALIESYIQDEALYRQGMALGLSEGDEIVRRRIIQKMDFLGEGDIREPTEADLRRYFAIHQARYGEPRRLSFTHLYFSPDRGGDARARTRARAALADAHGGKSAVAIAADPFPDGQSFALLDKAGIERFFGETELARMVWTLPPGTWAGPFRSGYGWHIAKVETSEPARNLSFAEAAGAVRGDWIDEQRERLKQRTIATILRGYTVDRNYRSRS